MPDAPKSYDSVEVLMGFFLLGSALFTCYSMAMWLAEFIAKG